MRLRRICLIALAVIGIMTGRAVAQPGYDVPVESFYDELAPYGEWSQYPGYGDVWRPDADPNFQPYASNGHWIVTEYGNTWVSDYDWGWAPFHYGRWLFDQAYGGWLWVPGSDWGPAWVSWRSGGGYYGWAPLGPGAGFNPYGNIPAPYWTFVPQIYITSPRLYSYCVPRPRVVNIYQNTTIINNVYRTNNRAYNYGPQRVEIERITRRSVPVYRVDYRDRPGRTVVANGSVGFYRPNPSVTNRRTYGRADRSGNGQQYGGYSRGSGGYNSSNRDYNRSAAPDANPGERTYDRRGTYTREVTPNGGSGTATPNPGRGSYTTPNRRERVEPTPNSGSYTTPNRPDRYGPNRGSYSPAPNGTPAPANESPRPNRSSYPAPGNAAPNGSQQPTRTYERPNRPQASDNAPAATPMPGQADGTYQRPDNRRAAPQQTQESGVRRGDRGQFTPGERPSRGPR